MKLYHVIRIFQQKCYSYSLNYKDGLTQTQNSSDSAYLTKMHQDEFSGTKMLDRSCMFLQFLLETWNRKIEVQFPFRIEAGLGRSPSDTYKVSLFCNFKVCRILHSQIADEHFFERSRLCSQIMPVLSETSFKFVITKCWTTSKSSRKSRKGKSSIAFLKPLIFGNRGLIFWNLLHIDKKVQLACLN